VWPFYEATDSLYNSAAWDPLKKLYGGEIARKILASQ